MTSSEYKMELKALKYKSRSFLALAFFLYFRHIFE